MFGISVFDLCAASLGQQFNPKNQICKMVEAFKCNSLGRIEKEE